MLSFPASYRLFLELKSGAAQKKTLPKEEFFSALGSTYFSSALLMSFSQLAMKG